MHVTSYVAVIFGHDSIHKGRNMKKVWKKPEIVEIAVGLEINSYACAELKK